MKHATCAMLALAALLLVPGEAIAADTSGARIVFEGAASGAPPCAACHGDHLQGTPALKSPAIAGLDVRYILMRLEHYAGPEGHNPQMKQVATTLTAQEKRAVADYLAGLRR